MGIWLIVWENPRSLAQEFGCWHVMAWKLFGNDY